MPLKIGRGAAAPPFLVMDVIARVPGLGTKGAYLKQMMTDKLVEHKHYIDKHGEDLPEIRNWVWGQPS